MELQFSIPAIGKVIQNSLYFTSFYVQTCRQLMCVCVFLDVLVSVRACVGCIEKKLPYNSGNAEAESHNI